MTTKLYEGQELLFVPSRGHHRQKVVVIDKVARKWATIKGHIRWKLNIESMIVMDSDHSLGQCYVDIDGTLEALRMEKEWAKLRIEVSDTRQMPQGLTAEKLAAVRELLGLK